MNPLNRNTAQTPAYPVKILQFGEGNFLRAFADWMIDMLNEKADYQSGVAVVQPIPQGMVAKLKEQDGLFHHLLRGLSDGQIVDESRLISCIQQLINPFDDPEQYFAQALNEDLTIVISNTTEAGIKFSEGDSPEPGKLAATFPGKLTQLLKARFDHFKGAPESGLIFIPCELIDRNGDKLKEAILNYTEIWNYPEAFVNWLDRYNYFGNTLVDRIVPGFPKDDIKEIQQNLGYEDNLVVSSEAFHLWVIEGPAEIEVAFPASKVGLNVKFVDDMEPYRTRKVRILNGAHTAMVPIGLLAGIETVKEAVEDEVIGQYIREILFEEIMPNINMPESELREFAENIIERFRNPFIRHELKSISLNSISKFKVRVLPSLLDYIKREQQLPKGLTIALASLIKLYLSADFDPSDDPKNLQFFEEVKSRSASNEGLINAILGNTAFWDMDLNTVTGLNKEVLSIFNALETESTKNLLAGQKL
ncbi:tagaturonate reductase [Fulvivirgaceae bacterium BMA12]|uniref:Tagaturonate reductase n=1 Tax=Agaribacillus aureus TaxID=3051825 RepID=A0ABT8L1R5_9BACT|nr:tagaturonate reductase [Fulvivirgaceae bacterium BMA12]